MNHDISRADRNRVRRAREDDRPINHLALAMWASRCTSKAFPGQAFVPFDYALRLMYRAQDVKRIGYRRFPPWIRKASTPEETARSFFNLSRPDPLGGPYAESMGKPEWPPPDNMEKP